MVVNYDVKDGRSTIFDLFKDNSKITDEVSNALERLKGQTIDNVKSAKELADMVGYNNQKFFEFAKQADLSGDLLQQYTDYMRLGTSAAKKFGAAIKSIGANMAIMLAINLVATFAYKAWDQLVNAAENATEAMDESVAAYEESKSKIESLNKELEQTEKLINDLLAKDNPSYADDSELQKLQSVSDQLTIQIALLKKKEEIQAKLAAKDTTKAYEENFKTGVVTEESISGYKEEMRDGINIFDW